MSVPLVSVITPVYNAQRFIGETIQSVLNQTYRHWEMLVIDDGSTDGTRVCIEPYLRDSRVTYIYQENQERAVARNNGICRASGKYIAFLDADDLWLPKKLQHQVESLEARPEVGLCFTNCNYVDNSGEFLYTPKINPAFQNAPFYYLLQNNFITNSTVMVPWNVFDKVGLFDETLPAFGAEDWDMWLRITQRYPIYLINQPLTLYREHNNNTLPHKMYLSQEAVLQRVFSKSTLPDVVVRDKAKIYSLFDLRQSEIYSHLFERKKAFEHWRQAIRIYPQGIFTTGRGLRATLKLLLPYSLVAKVSQLSKIL